MFDCRDRIYRLSISSLQLLESTTWSADPDKITSCLKKGQPETDCRNYIKVLQSSGTKLFACGTNAFSPQCSWREVRIFFFNFKNDTYVCLNSNTTLNLLICNSIF